MGNTCREDLRIKRTERFVVTDSRHAAGVRLTPHSHPFACIHLVTAGVYSEVIEGLRYDVRPGEALFKPSCAGHSNDFGGTGARSVRVEVRRPVGEIERALGRLRSLGCGVVVSACGVNPAGLRAMLCEDRAWSCVALEGACLGLLARVGSAIERDRSHPSSEWEALARAAVSAAREGFRGRVSLGRIACELGVSDAWLARAVRRATGKTLGEHVREWRTEWVAERLRDSSDSVGTISAQAGFADQSHCCRVFRRVMGVSPAEFRGRGGQPRSTRSGVQDG